MLSAIHNHTGCGIFQSDDPEDSRKGQQYQQLVMNNAVEAVKLAKAAMRPAKYGYGEGKSYLNVNRDMPDEWGNYVQAPNPEGYSDKTVSVIKFVDEDENLICAISNYGMHATMGFLQPDVDGKMKVSGNLPGAASEYVEARYGKGAVALWTSAAAGDQGPRFGMLRNYAPDGFAAGVDPDPGMVPGTEYRLNTWLGGQHGVDICKTLNSITHYRETMPIRFVETTVNLPAQKAPEGADMVKNRQYVERILRMPEGESLVEMVDDTSRQIPLYIQQAILGDIALIGIAAEIYSLIGKACKEISPYKKTMVITHVGKSAGYIMDKTSAHHKVFQSFSWVKPGVCDDLIVDTVNRQFEELMG